MKMNYILAFAALLSGLVLTCMAADAPAKKGKLRHVDAFKFKETATPEQIKQVETAFKGLKKKISEIADFEWGLNNSPENKNKGCTHGYILTFKSEKDRDTYINHPAHKEFGGLVGPLVADVFVIDFWAQN